MTDVLQYVQTGLVSLILASLSIPLINMFPPVKRWKKHRRNIKTRNEINRLTKDVYIRVAELAIVVVDMKAYQHKETLANITHQEFISAMFQRTVSVMHDLAMEIGLDNFKRNRIDSDMIVMIALGDILTDKYYANNKVNDLTPPDSIGELATQISDIFKGN